MIHSALSACAMSRRGMWKLLLLYRYERGALGEFCIGNLEWKLL